MKKTLLSVLSLATVASLNAQVTITSADFPAIGSSVTLVIDSMPTISVGGSGAGQTWDLSGIASHELQEDNFIDPATTSFAADFPTSTVALEGGTQDTYFTNGADSATIDGFAGDPFGAGLNMAIPFDNKEVLITFPSVLGTTFDDTAHFNVAIDATPLGLPVAIDSFRLDHVAITTSTIDAEGSVTTPGGTYNAIRQYKVQSTEDFVEIFVSDAITAAALGVPANQWAPAPVTPGFLDENPVTDTTYKYLWIANGEDLPVAEVETDDQGNVERAQYKYNNNLLVFIDSEGNAACAASCDGDATVSAQGGTSNYTYTWADGQATAMATGLCSGTHIVTISDGNESSSLTVTVGEDSPWTASINAWENASCATCTDGSATAAANGGTAPYTYLWNDGAAQTTETATGLVAGSYDCTITDANGCSAVTNSTTVTRIEDNVIANSVSVFPNPTNGVLNIVSTNAVVKSYVIYNAIGKVVSGETVNANTTAIELEGFDSGIYFVTISTEQGTIQKKITLVK